MRRTFHNTECLPCSSRCCNVSRACALHACYTCIIRMLHMHYTHVVTLVPLTERGPSVSNGSTNALTDQFVNIHCPVSNQCSHSALHVHRHYFTRPCAFEVCATVLKTIKHATDSRQQRVMVQQVCNATSYHYHDGVGQASGMAQTIIRNTTSTVKCIYSHIEFCVRCHHL